MIRLATLFPDRLNLNGDQGNLLVLQKRLKAYGEVFESVNFEPGDPLSKLDGINFLLIGHGSNAAWKSLATELERVASVLQKLVNDGAIVLAVATGAEKLYSEPFRFVNEKLTAIARRSQFEVASDGDLKVLGYANTASSLPTFERIGSLMVTSFHGPVLAKNPKLADRILEKLGAKVSSNTEIETLDSAIPGIWELEEKLANE